MKKINSDYLLLKDRVESAENRVNFKDSLDNDDFDELVKAPSIKDSDIQLTVEKLNDPQCCLNDYLEKIIKSPQGLFQILEIRKRNIKIKVYSRLFGKEIFCKYCNEKCLKFSNLQEKEINFAETHSKICICDGENHDISRQKTNFTTVSSNDKKINDLIDLAKDSSAVENKELIKESFFDLIKGQDNDKILQIFSEILNKYETHVFFYSLDYKDDLYLKMLSCIKQSNDYSSFNNIMVHYMRIYFFNQVMFEIPIYSFNMIFVHRNAYALYYYNPDIFSYSFFFQIFRKKIISKNIESNEFISFLRKLGFNNDILCSHMLNEIRLIPDFFPFGFFSLDSISYLNTKDLTKFKQFINYMDIIYIQANQFCDIFLDFIYNGCTKNISLYDKSNYFSKLFIEKIIDSIQLFLSTNIMNYVDEIKNILISYPLFKFRFYDENKHRIITLLSSYAYSISQQQNIFKDCDNYEKIFDLIKKKIVIIVNQSKLRKKNDSQQNILIVKKVLEFYDLYDSKNISIKELYLYDFNNLLQNIIENDYPIKLADEILKIIRAPFNNPEETKLLETYIDYLLKITLICCINIVGGTYIYNSNFIPKILEIIKKLNYNDYSHFILEMLMILKICFNRIIIDISFLGMRNDDEEVTLKEYLIDILFRNEPIISNVSMYDFNIFNRLLNRINTIYSFIFEKKNKDILPDAFVDINFEDSYLNIIKSISSNTNEEFCKINWKNESIRINNLSNIEKEKFIDENEKRLEKKINEEINKNKEHIPGFILLDFLRCLENLNQTNFYLKYDENSYLIDDKFDITSIIINDKLPLAVKSLILNYLLKLVLCLKFDPNSHKNFSPLLYTSRFEKTADSLNVVDKYLITLESNESEKHLNESIKLINIFEICIQLLKRKKNSLNSKKAFIEKNGLYDYCVSIVYALYCFSNLIINTNKIHDLYLSSFIKFALKFFENEDIFKNILYQNIEDEEIFKINNNQLDYQEKISIVVKTNEAIKKYIDKINSNKYNFSDRNLTGIYQSYIDYHKGKLSISTNNHYSFVLDKKGNEITLEDLNEFNGLDSRINSKILNNYNKWIEYNNSEAFKIKDLFEKVLDIKRSSSNKRELFYCYILLNISDIYSTSEYILNDHLFLKALIRIIRSDEKFKIVCDDKLELIMKDFLKEKQIDFEDAKARIIGSIIRKIYFLTNYKLLISPCFSNTKQENELSELLNSLILFFEVLGENFNHFFHDAIFKYKFDLSSEKSNIPVAKYDEESKTFKMLDEKVDEKKIYSPYEVLLELHKKIFESLKITSDKNYRETQQNNLLIIFNSLTYCIIEYTNFENPDYSAILGKLYLQYFYWQREDKSFNPIFQALNFEIDHKLIGKTKYIFMIYNILSLFVFYIRYGTKENSTNYFYQSRNYFYYNPNIYLFHTFIYTSQIVKYFDQNLLKSTKNIEKIIELYKQGKFQDIQLFSIAQKYYEIIFIAKKFYGYNELKSVFPNYEVNRINSNKIIEYLADSGYYSNLINSIILNDDFLDEFLDESQKLSTFQNYSKQMDIIFSFWRTIFDDIEVLINDKKQIVYYILRPENLYISNSEKIFYEDIIDYSSRDSRLMSLYENIDSYIFEMISNRYNEKFNLAKIFYYYGLELINIILFIIQNIILLILYYKSWKEDFLKYNDIENNKSSIVLYILSGVHILYIIIIIINWFINRLNIDYYYALSQYSSDNFNSKLFRPGLRMKSFKLRKLFVNYSTKFSAINEFFPELKYEKIYVLIVNTILLNPKVYPFIISLICLVLHIFVSQIFLVIPLLLLAKLIPTLSAIFIGLFSKFKYLIFVYIYTLLVLYIFSWIAFLFLPKLFKSEVVDENNENLVDNNQQFFEENVCSSSIQCFLYFANFGLSSGGSLDLNLISFKSNYGYYLRQFFFEIFLFLLINMIFSNVFLALITDAFAEMRELAWKKENDKVNVCFICDLNKSDCINQNLVFDKHIQDHSKWKYINFMSKLILDDDIDFNNEEYYIWNLVKKRSINWFPNK